MLTDDQLAAVVVQWLNAGETITANIGDRVFHDEPLGAVVLLDAKGRIRVVKAIPTKNAAH